MTIFFCVGAPDSEECQNNVAIMKVTCDETGLQRTNISFLGIELDTIAGEIRLPQSKLEAMRVALAVWQGRRACKKRELLSLISTLSHAAKAVKAGRSFVHRLIDLSITAQLCQAGSLGPCGGSSMVYTGMECQ